jgi:putative transposase
MLRTAGQATSQRLCKTLGVIRAGYYAWLDEAESVRARRDRELTPWVHASSWRHKRRYGARRIAQELKFRGRPSGVARVANLLKNQGLQAIQPRSFRPRTIESRHALGYSPNLLRDRDEPRRINEVWVADITYVRPSTGGFGYLSLLLDLFSRRIVGWEFLEEMSEELVLSTISDEAVALVQLRTRMVTLDDISPVAFEIGR